MSDRRAPFPLAVAEEPPVNSGAGLLLAARLSATSLILSVVYSKAESNPVPVGTAIHPVKMKHILCQIDTN
jgi:hypothetical protein